MGVPAGCIGTAAAVVTRNPFEPLASREVEEDSRLVVDQPCGLRRMDDKPPRCRAAERAQKAGRLVLRSQAAACRAPRKRASLGIGVHEEDSGVRSAPSCSVNSDVVAAGSGGEVQVEVFGGAPMSPATPGLDEVAQIAVERRTDQVGCGVGALVLRPGWRLRPFQPETLLAICDAAAEVEVFGEPLSPQAHVAVTTNGETGHDDGNVGPSALAFSCYRLLLHWAEFEDLPAHEADADYGMEQLEVVDLRRVACCSHLLRFLVDMVMGVDDNAADRRVAFRELCLSDEDDAR